MHKKAGTISTFFMTGFAMHSQLQSMSDGLVPNMQLCIMPVGIESERIYVFISQVLGLSTIAVSEFKKGIAISTWPFESSASSSTLVAPRHSPVKSSLKKLSGPSGMLHPMYGHLKPLLT
jgi:hypothetical protein